MEEKGAKKEREGEKGSDGGGVMEREGGRERERESVEYDT